VIGHLNYYSEGGCTYCIRFDDGDVQEVVYPCNMARADQTVRERSAAFPRPPSAHTGRQRRRSRRVAR